jgi:hypothetical protein
MNENYWILQASNAQAEIELLRAHTEKLEKFYKEVSELCIKHDVVHSIDGNSYASVDPRKLGDLLATINKEWYK